MKTGNLLITGIVIFMTAITTVFAQPDWKRVNYETSTVFTGFVKINGNNADVNDLVGIFVNNECRMVSKIIIVNDTSFVSAVIHSNGTPELAVVKYWDSQTNTIYTLDTLVPVENHGTVKRFPIILKSGNVVDDLPQVSTEETLEIYPSPVINVLHIDSSKPLKNIDIYNSIGEKLVSKKESATTNATIEVNNLSSGLYLVSIEFTDGTIVTKKVFKK
jgi:hypothetical protein